MNTPIFNNNSELELYCSLLPLAYIVQIEQTGGLISGTVTEEIRDGLYRAIKESNII